jgi:glycosyltransferase involved in cell wall biosynthesis
MPEIPMVSVLMTAYNREKYISEAIESVLASTYKDFELVIVDDCSSDKTVEIAKQYEAKDNRVKVFVNEKNLGDYPNRNKAASYGRGTYLKYLDSDDVMRNDCLEKMVSQMELCPECAFGISSRSLNHSIIHTPENSYRVHFFERGILDISPSGSIIRNDVFKIENGFWETRCVSDFEFWLRLAKKYAVIEMEKDLIYWREHEGQEINLGRIEYLEHNINIVSEKLKGSCLTEAEQNEILKSYRKATSRQILKNFRPLHILEAIRLFRMNKLSLFDAI